VLPNNEYVVQISQIYIGLVGAFGEGLSLKFSHENIAVMGGEIHSHGGASGLEVPLAIEEEIVGFEYNFEQLQYGIEGGVEVG